MSDARINQEDYSSTEKQFRDELAEFVRTYQHQVGLPIANELADLFMRFAKEIKGYLNVPPPPRCEVEEGALGVRCELREKHEIHLSHFKTYNPVSKKDDDWIVEVRWPVKAEVMDLYEQ